MKECGHGNSDLTYLAAVRRLFSRCVPSSPGRCVDHQDELPSSWPTGSATKMKMKTKLAVDRSRNRVLFADAGSDVVEVLLSFLTVPLSVLHLMAGLSSSDCLTNLCDSVNDLRNSELVKVHACHRTLLMPMLSDGFSEHVKHCKCCHVLARLVHVCAEVWSTEASLRGKERFVISDDWAIKPASTTCLLSLPQAFGADGIGHDFEEVEVCVGWAEVVSMLKASLSSDTIFTDVFLSKGTPAKSSTDQNILLPSNKENSDSSPESKIKIYYDKHEKKVMYAECDHGFVDLLLGFLTYPVYRVIKNRGDAGTSHQSRSLNNLYSSAVDLRAIGFLSGCFPKEMLLHPSLMPFPRVVEDREYIVEDDLQIHQASAMSVMKHWCKRNRVKVKREDITVGKHEAAVLMQAVFTSKMALTDVFKSRLEMMQILVKVEAGKTIIVDEVASSDTIAVLKSKIRNKVPIPAACRGELLYNGKFLRDSWTVAKYNIVGGHTIHLRIFVPPFAQNRIPWKELPRELYNNAEDECIPSAMKRIVPMFSHHTERRKARGGTTSEDVNFEEDGRTCILEHPGTCILEHWDIICIERDGLQAAGEGEHE